MPQLIGSGNGVDISKLGVPPSKVFNKFFEGLTTQEVLDKIEKRRVHLNELKASGTSQYTEQDFEKAFYILNKIRAECEFKLRTENNEHLSTG